MYTVSSVYTINKNTIKLIAINQYIYQLISQLKSNRENTYKHNTNVTEPGSLLIIGTRLLHSEEKKKCICLIKANKQTKALLLLPSLFAC